MRLLLGVWLCLVATTLATAQNLQDTLGKTNGQILTMGHDAWYKFYTGKQGDSTAAMSSAEGLYADALMARNKNLMARLKPTEKARFIRLQKNLQEFTNNAIGAGTCLTGGGTMWNPIGASMVADSETALYRVLAGQNGKAPSRVVSQAAIQIAALKADLAKAKLDMNWPQVAKESLAGIDAAFKAIVADAKTLSRKDSDVLLDFCITTIKDTRETAGPS